MFCFLFIFHKDLVTAMTACPPFLQWDTSSAIFTYICRLCLFALLCNIYTEKRWQSRENDC